MNQRLIKSILFLLVLISGIFFVSRNFIGQAQTKFELDGNMLKTPKPVMFETGSDKLKPESEESFKIKEK